MPVFVEEYIREIEEEALQITFDKRKIAKAYIEEELGIKEDENE